MQEKQILIRICVLGFVLVLTVFSVGSDSLFDKQLASLGQAKESPYLKVAFLDVGQGDSIFITTPDGKQMLIDGGPDNGVLRELAKQMSVFDRTIDVVLATHPDKDHIGGLVDVLQRYEVENIVRTNNKNETAVSEAFDREVEFEGVEVQIAEAGQVFQLGASTTITVLSPHGNPESWESNSSSIVVQVQYGEVGFMLTGDATENIEEYLAKSYSQLLESEVLKLGHHGSRTSSADLFLDTVKPEYAVVSAGSDNSYGHPHPEVIDKVNLRKIKTLSTAEEGTIVFLSDGKKVRRE